jgi:hypothetical protein
VTTAGSGSLAAHSALCRKFTSIELAISLPMLGLALGGIAARLFRLFRPEELDMWRYKNWRKRHDRRVLQQRWKKRLGLESAQAWFDRAIEAVIHHLPPSSVRTAEHAQDCPANEAGRR